MSSLAHLLTGRTLDDRYRIDRVIGKGGMGAVYLATDQRLERAVALKVITVEVDDRARARFRREAQSAARIRHPHVVTVYDRGTDSVLELDYLVMEMLPGEDLAARLARGPLHPTEALRFLAEIADGLAEGHRLGMVHRDIKPGNIFLARGRSQDRAVLLDFGIAQLADDDTATRTHLTQIGRFPYSPAYASPEQVRGNAALGFHSDVFSLGMVAHLALFGTPAYTPEQIQALALGGTAPRPAMPAAPGVPAAAVECIRRALSPDPRDRPADANAFRNALLDLQSAEESTYAATVRPSAAASVAAASAPGQLHQDVPRTDGGAASRQNPTKALRMQPSRSGTKVLFGGTMLLLVAALPMLLARTTEDRPDDVAPLMAVPDSVAEDAPGARPIASVQPRRSDGAAPSRRSAPADRPPETRRADSETPRLQQPRPEAVRERGAGGLSVSTEMEVDAESDGTKTYDATDVTVGPSLLNGSEMAHVLSRSYPPLLRDAGVSGVVQVKMRINHDGRVDAESVEILETSHEAFGDAAKRVVERMRFRPAELNGRPVNVWALLPVTFQVPQ